MQTKTGLWLLSFCVFFCLFPQTCPAQAFTLESALTDASANAPEVAESARKLNEIQARLDALDVSQNDAAFSWDDWNALRSELQTARSALEKARVKARRQLQSAYIEAYCGRLSVSNLDERVSYLEIYLSQIEKAARLGKVSQKTRTAVSLELSQLRDLKASAADGSASALNTLSRLTARKYAEETLLSEPAFYENPRFDAQKQILIQAEKRLSSAERMLDMARDDLKYGKITNAQYNQFQKKKTDAASEYLQLQSQYLSVLSGAAGESSGGSGNGGA
jgi:hypothetical protein